MWYIQSLTFSTRKSKATHLAPHAASLATVTDPRHAPHLLYKFYTTLRAKARQSFPEKQWTESNARLCKKLANFRKMNENMTNYKYLGLKTL